MSPLAHLNTYSRLGEREKREREREKGGERERSYYSELAALLTLILIHPWHGQKVAFNEVRFKE